MEQNSIVANNRQKLEYTNIPKSKRTLSQDTKVIKTRTGRIIKKWTDWYTHNNNHQPGLHAGHSNIFCTANHIISQK